MYTNIYTRVVRQQYALSKSLYVKRAELVAKIPNFWQVVFAQDHTDIHKYTQGFDLPLLVSSLKSISVSRFELDEDEKKGDPRSIAIRFEFADNDYFEDKVLEKKFWWRQSNDGVTCLVSEPVEIRWKKGKDLSDGLLALVKAVYDERQAKGKKEKVALTEKQKALREKIDKTDMDSASLFSWFGYIGEYITAEESRKAIAEEKEERRKRKAGEEVAKKDDDDGDDEMGDDDEDDTLNIFPTGDTVATTIADNIWRGAIGYFSESAFVFVHAMYG